MTDSAMVRTVILSEARELNISQGARARTVAALPPQADLRQDDKKGRQFQGEMLADMAVPEPEKTVSLDLQAALPHAERYPKSWIRRELWKWSR